MLNSRLDNDDDDEYEAISYSTDCQLLGEETSGLKLDMELKHRIQEEERRNCTVGITSSEVKVLNNITPDKMRKAQMEDRGLVEVIKYVEVHGKALSYARIRKFKSSVVRKYMLQSDRLILIKGVLH